MPFLPDNITKDHVLQSIDLILSQKIVLKNSTKYDVVINGQNFPPKEVLRYAHELMNGERIWDYSGGEPTNKYLQKMGFWIIEKQYNMISELISKYKAIIRQTEMNEELYKWRLIQQYKGLPRLEAVDFGDELSSVDYSNLIYKLGRAVLNDISKQRPEELKNCFKNLFDESINLEDRVRSFTDTTLKIYREWMSDFNHHQDERSISVYLSFHSPEKYAIYKHSYYSKYCELIGEQKSKKGFRYIHYLALLNDFIDEYIKPDQELIELVNEFKTNDCYADPNYLLLAQDILYQTLEKSINSINYWAGGYHWYNINKLNEFFEAGVWQMGWSLDDERGKRFYNLINKVSEGDYIVLKSYGGKHDLSLNGLGKVIDVSNSEEGILGVDWVIKNEFYRGKAPTGSGAGNWQNTLLQITRQSEISQFFTDNLQELEITQVESEIGMKNFHSLNQILYGPPGTGKTYNSINHALAIVESKELELIENESKKNRGEILRRFQSYVDSGQVVFTTFHQSMSYEDFVEGIKPIEADGQLHYEVQNGVFKSIADEALVNFKNSKLKTGKKVFDAVWNSFLSPLNEEEGINVKMKKSSFTIVQVNERTIFFDKSSGDSKHTLSVNTLKSMYEAGANQIIKGGLQPYYEALLNQLLVLGNESEKVEQKNYVIIIDEINRGNVAQIFGELITLIETDKRFDNKEALSVTLPYSKKKGFAIPPNLYIIGTMNTADRSVEALDTALRRRFTFIEMPPQYNLPKLENEIIDGISLEKLMKTLNARIEKLLDKDHLIGHSYFLLVDNISDLQKIFHQNIIPLLQEYFYGDFAKIGLVLGEAFFEKNETSKNTVFARFVHDAADELNEKPVYRLKQEWAEDDFISAIKEMVNP